MKRRLFKSILSLFLCLSMILVPINVYAAGDTGNSVVETPNGNIIITELNLISIIPPSKRHHLLVQVRK